MAHDMKATGAMHPLASEVIKACLPSGQVKPFPDNCLSLMTVTGARQRAAAGWGSCAALPWLSCGWCRQAPQLQLQHPHQPAS